MSVPEAAVNHFWSIDVVVKSKSPALLGRKN